MRAHTTFGRVLFISFALSLAVSFAETGPTIRDLSKQVARPPAFEENLGQADPEADFVYRTPGGSISISAHGIEYQLRVDDALQRSALVLEGADHAAFSRGLEPTRQHSHYFMGNDPSAWVHDARNFRRVRYDGIYPGVAVEYYFRDGYVEYDFVVAPGAGAGRIRLRIESENAVELTAGGDLKVGELTHRRPIAQQVINGKTVAVAAEFAQQADGTFGFRLGDYDRTEELVIDPLTYATYFGGAGEDVPTSMALLPDGDAVILGYSTSTSFTAPGLTSVGDIPGARSAFLMRLTRSQVDAEVSWDVVDFTLFGGSGDDFANDVLVDQNGDVVATGSTTSPNFPRSFGPAQGTAAWLLRFQFSQAAALNGDRPTPRQVMGEGHILDGSGDDRGSQVTELGDGSVFWMSESNSQSIAGCQGSSQGGMDLIAYLINGPGGRCERWGGSQDEGVSELLTIPGTNQAVAIGSTRSTDLVRNPVGDHFKANINWQAFGQVLDPDPSGFNYPGGAYLNEGFGSDGVFSFFDDVNWEMLVKVLDSSPSQINSFWVFAAATTNVEVTLTVTDTQTGGVQTYENPIGLSQVGDQPMCFSQDPGTSQLGVSSFASVGDTEAFVTEPPSRSQSTPIPLEQTGFESFDVGSGVNLQDVLYDGRGHVLLTGLMLAGMEPTAGGLPFPGTNEFSGAFIELEYKVVDGVFSSANFAERIAVGSIATVFPIGFDDAVSIVPPEGATVEDLEYPVQAMGYSVDLEVGPGPDRQAFELPLLFVGTQLGFFVPELPIIEPTPALLRVNRNDESSTWTSVTLLPKAPAVFTQNSSGRGLASVLRQDFSVIGLDNVGQADEIFQIFFTGGGSTDGGGCQAGKFAAFTGTLLNFVNDISVSIGGESAEIFASVAAPNQPCGLGQINAKLNLAPGRFEQLSEAPVDHEGPWIPVEDPANPGQVKRLALVVE